MVRWHWRLIFYVNLLRISPAWKCSRQYGCKPPNLSQHWGKLIETASQLCTDELLSSLSLWWWKQNRESAFNGWNCSVGIWELIFFSCSAYFSTHCWFVQNERGEAAQFVFWYSNEADHSEKTGTFNCTFSCCGIVDRCPTGTSKVD